MTVPGAEDATLRDPLRAAIAAGTIEVHYQPVVVADTGRLRGFEALARWQLDGTPIAPNRFIPLAERLGLAGALGAQVLRTALAQLADWSRDRGDDDLVMSVNLSADQVSDPGLPHLVGRLLDEYRVQPRQLVLEITEGALLTDDPNALATARALADLGVALALDDFGTGYSSLAHLRRFPLTVLKIDRAFVADIDNDDQARCFLRAIARLGRDLGLRLVAEGVERRTQLDLVRELGPTLVQGYLFSPPKPAPELAAVVAPAEAAPWARAPRPLGTPRPAIEARSV
jgi:EAL domain-containing protein (putative c-di-GMP-specific phosphodiesterase class I)